ncbi:unnamed protein product [Effrenium voratum]|nr:unnamed protein product [Effrenium voratum]
MARTGARPVGQVRLSARRAVEQVCATGGFVFVLLDGVLSALPGNVQSSAPVELCKDVKHMCLHTGDAGTNAEVCAATRKKLVLFAHNGMTFEQRQVSGAKHDYIAGVHDCTYKVFSTDWGHGESVREKI